VYSLKRVDFHSNKLNVEDSMYLKCQRLLDKTMKSGQYSGGLEVNRKVVDVFF
jgi:hypothetical protein